MEKIDLAQQLGCWISQLQSMYLALKDQVLQLSKALEQQQFISKDLGQEVGKSLEEILTLQRDVLMQCETLGLGTQVLDVLTVAEQVAKLEKSLSVEASYGEIITICLNLVALDDTLVDDLEALKKVLHAYEISGKSQAQLEEDLVKYKLLISVIAEQDPKTKFNNMMALHNQFDSNILFGVQMGRIVLGTPDNTSEDEATPEMISVVTPVEADVVEAVEICEAEEAVAEMKPTVDLEIVEQEEDGITWESLGIAEKDGLITILDNDELICIQSEKKKEFSVKEFKSNFDKLKPNTSLAYGLLRTAKDKRGMTLELAESKVPVDEQQPIVSILEKMVHLGYFRKYTLENFEDLHQLTNKGAEAFCRKDAAKLLHEPLCNRSDMHADEVETAHEMIAEVVRLSLSRQLLHLEPYADISVESAAYGNCGFIVTYGDAEREKLVGFVGAFGETPKVFSNVKEHLEKQLAGCMVTVVIGLSTQQGKNIATWVAKSLPEQTIWYMDYSTKTYYRLCDDTEVNITEPFAVLDKHAEGEPEHEEAAVVEETAPEIFQDEEPTVEPIAVPVVVELESESEMEEEAVPEVVQKEAATPIVVPTVVVEKLEQAAETISSAVVESVPQVVKISENLSMPAQEKGTHLALCQQMLVSEKFYCATAYLKALADKYVGFQPWYKGLAYALNDPLAHCRYSSDKMFEVYFNDNPIKMDHCVIAATLRNYFMDHCQYDYTLKQLQVAVDNMDMPDMGAVQQILYTLFHFKDKVGHGIDFYADHRQKQREKFEQHRSEICQEAESLYDSYIVSKPKETAKNPRFLETKRLVFDKTGDIGTYLEAVKGNNTEYGEMLCDYLRNMFLKDGEPMQPSSIDRHKIEKLVDYYWEESGKRIALSSRSSKLMSSLRMNLVKSLEKIGTTLCKYARLLEGNLVAETDSGLLEYKKIKIKLMAQISESLEALSQKCDRSLECHAGRAVLKETLGELLHRLDGTYEEDDEQYYYLPFLAGSQILLSEDYLPILDDVLEIPEMSALARIQKHFQQPEEVLENRLKMIVAGQDDYGSAELLLEYLKKHPQMVQDKTVLDMDLPKYVENPQKSMVDERKRFMCDLELAQSYGKIDNTRENQKEILSQIMESWYQWAQNTNNYGFFKEILHAIKEKIQKDSQTRAEELRRNVKTYQASNPEWNHNELVTNAIDHITKRIESQNYAAAEDLLNRLIGNDLQSGDASLQIDYLENFMREYHNCYQTAGASGNTLRANYQRVRNKEDKGALRLVDNWPSRNGMAAVKIRGFLETLGFAVAQVTKQADIQGKDHYAVTMKKPINGRKSNYQHAIAAFGSEAEVKGFRVVCLYGKMNAESLINTFKEIGRDKNTLVLLDGSLTVLERRELAKRSKTELFGKTFAVLDRVALVYLANHYSETSMLRMAMSITMPFASYQPYVVESSKIMPPEIFMGRQTELEKIESSSGVNIVYGGRQLGKSALLRMAQKDINCNENGDRAILVDIKELDYQCVAKKLSQALYDEGILKTEHITADWDKLARDVKNRLRDTENPIPYFLLLLDEADAFIESCEAVGYHPFDALKDIQGIGEGRFKFVVAGLRNIVRFKKKIALNDNSVLTQLSALTITPFKAMEARELLEVPLSQLGFRFPHDEQTEMLVSTIFGTTNYFPGLLQLYCTKLIEAVQRDYAGYAMNNTPPYVVSETHIKSVLSDPNLENQIREKFFITLKVGGDDYYYLIALLTAYHYHNYRNQNGCSAQNILAIAQDYEIEKITSLSVEEVEALMVEMQELNVLQLVGKGLYRFSRLSFCQMMGTMENIDDEIIGYGVN